MQLSVNLSLPLVRTQADSPWRIGSLSEDRFRASRNEKKDMLLHLSVALTADPEVTLCLDNPCDERENFS
jgi:hypothetical protein